MIRKTFRIDYSNGINEIVDKSLLPEKFATVLDNVNIRSGFAEGFKEPIFYKVVTPITTTKIFKYRGRWIYSSEYRDYVYQFVEDQERIFFTSDTSVPKKIVNDSDAIPLGTRKPKSSVTVGFNIPLKVNNLEFKPMPMNQGKLKAQLYKYRIAGLTDSGWQHPSDEYGYNQLEDDGAVDISFNGIKGAKRYSIFRDSGDGYEKIDETESNTYVDTGEGKKDSTIYDDIANQLDKADHTYVYTYERDVNGMIDESGLSPISNTFNTTNERTVIRNVLSDGFFEQENVQNASSGFTVYSTSTHNPKITITKMNYIENIKHVQFTTSGNHKLKTDDEIIFAGSGWTNPKYYKQVYKVIVVSPTIFNIPNIPPPTDLDKNNNPVDGCYVQICKTRILMPQGSSDNLYHGDAVYFYAKDNTTEGTSTPQILFPLNRSEVYIPPAPIVTIGNSVGSLENRTYRYKVIAVSENGELSQASSDAVITTTASNQSINVTIPSAPTSGFSDFSHWLLFRESSNNSFKYNQNLKGDSDSLDYFDTNAKFAPSYIYNDTNAAGHWSNLETTIEALESPLTITQTNVNNVLTWYDENYGSYLKLQFNGFAKTNASGQIVNIANIGTITFDEFGEPDYPFNQYTIKLSYSYDDFVDGTYGPTFVAFEYSIDDGENWSVFATDDLENSKKYLGNNKREIEQVIYNSLSPVSPSRIKIRARIALTNISQSDASGNTNRVNPYIYFKNLSRPGPIESTFKQPYDVSMFPETPTLDSQVGDDGYVDIDTSTVTSSGAISSIRAIRPLNINTDSDVIPLVDGTYTKSLIQTGNGRGTGGSVTFTVVEGKIDAQSVILVSGGSGYLVDDVLTVNMLFPTQRSVNNTFWNPVFMVTGVQGSSGAGGNLLTASSTIQTGAKVDMKIHTLLIKATYDKETQIIDGLFKAYKYDSSGNPLSTGYIEINKYTPYWDNSATLTSFAKWVPRNGYYKYWNLYRTGAAGSYQLVDKIPIDKSIYYDSKSTAYLGENPTSYYTDNGAFGEIDVLFNTPPKDLKCLTEHFGMYFGISGNAVRWTPFGSPDAFPDTFMVTLPYKPLALKSYANSLMILCEDAIYRLEGNKPIEMSLSKTQVEDGCIAPHSVQSTSFGLVYLSKRGLMITNGQVAKCITEGKLKPSFFTATSKQTSDFNFWWMPTVGSYFYANLVSEFGYDENKQQISKFRNIRELTGINEAIRSFVWDGKYFIYWSNSPNDDFSGHTALCVDLAVESMPVTTLGINAVDIISDENDNVYALFANQGNASQENYNEFKSQMRQGIYDASKFKNNSGLSIWQLFAGDNYIPMTIRTGYKRIESNKVKNGVLEVGNPFDRKVYDYIDFYGNGNISAKAFIDGDYIVSGNIIMEQSFKKPRRLNLPAGKRIGYNLDIEVFGSTSKVVMEIAYKLPEED